ncbi:TPA: hypothetical protein H1008_00925 [archaeon]|nr:hypothetical protein [Candidatus Undinarchaeales archaeon SRR5007147.bin71]
MRWPIFTLAALALISSPALAADFSIAQGDVIEIDLNSTGRFSKDVSFVVASPLKYSLNGTKLTVNASGRGLHSIAILASDGGSHSTFVFSVEVNLVEIFVGENLTLVSLSEIEEIAEAEEELDEEVSKVDAIPAQAAINLPVQGIILNKELGKILMWTGFLMLSAALALKSRNQNSLFMQ